LPVLGPRNVDIYSGSKKLGKKSTITLSFSPETVFTCLNIGNDQTFAVGRKKGKSAELNIKFINAKNQINVNNYKLKFHKKKDYLRFKDSANKAGYSNTIKFKARRK